MPLERYIKVVAIVVQVTNLRFTNDRAALILRKGTSEG
jgi:hypothetical protein